jgi:hypothetical protein
MLLHIWVKMILVLTCSGTRQLFTLVGVGRDGLLTDGFFDPVGLAACLSFILFRVQRVGPRRSLLFVALMLDTRMVVIAVLTVLFLLNHR